MFTPSVQQKPVEMPQVSILPPAVENPKEEKVDSFAHKIFSSEIFRQIASIIGYIAVTIGSAFMIKKASEAFAGKKIGEFPADGVAKAGIDVLSKNVKDYIHDELKPKPIPSEIFNPVIRGVVELQKEAERREFMDELKV